MSVSVWCRSLWWSSAPSLCVGVNHILYILIKAIQTTWPTSRIPSPHPLSVQQACSFLKFLTYCYYGDNVVILHFSRTPTVWVTVWLYTHRSVHNQTFTVAPKAQFTLQTLFSFVLCIQEKHLWNVGFNATKQTEYSAETKGHGECTVNTSVLSSWSWLRCATCRHWLR